MFEKTFHATHPDMMSRVENDELRDRYLVSGMFQSGKVVLNYSHNERFVIGGAAPAGGELNLPDPTEPKSAVGKPFLQRREMAVVNIGTEGEVRVDGQRCTFRWARKRSRSRAKARGTTWFQCLRTKLVR